MSYTRESLQELSNKGYNVIPSYAFTVDEVLELYARIDELTAGSEAMQKDAANNTITVKMLMEQLAELKAPIEDIKYYVGNPSAWEHYDDGVSEKIRAILKAAGMA